MRSGIRRTGVSIGHCLFTSSLGTVTSVAIQSIWYQAGGLSRHTADRTGARVSENTAKNRSELDEHAARRFGA